MWTLYGTDKRLNDKTFKRLIGECTRDHKENAGSDISSEYYLIDFGDNRKYNILLSVINIVSEMTDSELDRRVAKRFGKNELKSFSETVHRLDSYYGYKVHKMKSYRKKEDEQPKVDKAILYNMIPLQSAHSKFNMLLSLIKCNPDMLGEMLAEAMAISLIAINFSNGEYFINPLNIHFLIVYYWAYSKDYFNTFRVKMKDSWRIKAKHDTSVHKDATIFDFLRQQVKTKYTVNLVEKYVEKMFETGEERLASYWLLEEFIESVDKQAKVSKDIQDAMGECKSWLLKQKSDEKYQFILDKVNNKNIDKYVKAMMIGCVEVVNYQYRYGYWTMFLYMSKQYMEYGKLNGLAENTMKIIYNIILLNAKRMNTESTNFEDFILQGALPKLLENTEKLETKLDESNRKLEQARKYGDELKGKCKNLNKSLKESTDTIDGLNRRIDELTGIVKCNIKPEEYNTVCDQLNKARDEFDQLVKDKLAKDRELSHKDREIKELEDKLKQCEEDYYELLESNSRIEKLNSEIAGHRIYNEIPLECFINTIRDNRITVIGGDPMHSKLSGYNLSNLKLYKSKGKMVSTEELKSMDLVVIVASYVGHSTIEAAVRTCRQNNINLLNFNSLSAEGLIYAMFQELTKNK